MQKPKLLVILGPTASGKSDLGIRIAQDIKAEIINADSLQLYRHFDIGTAKPSIEDRNNIPHHLIDIINPEEEYNAGLFKKDADNLIEKLQNSSTNIILVGGTYLYIKVLLSGIIGGIPSDKEYRDYLRQKRTKFGNDYLHNCLNIVDPVSAVRIHTNDYIRIERALEVHYLTGEKISDLQHEHRFADNPYEYYKIGTYIETEELKSRIEQRVDTMISGRLVDEVLKIRKMDFKNNIKPMQSIGYKQINDYLDELCKLEEAVEKIKIETRRLAKRQMTWLKQDKEIKWVKVDEQYDEILEGIKKFIVQ